MLTLELTFTEGLVTAYVPGLRVDRPDLLRPSHYYAAGRYSVGNVLLVSMRLDQVRAVTYLDLDDIADLAITRSLLEQASLPVMLRTSAGTNITLTSPQSPVKRRELGEILALAGANQIKRRDFQEAISAFEKELV